MLINGIMRGSAVGLAALLLVSCSGGVTSDTIVSPDGYAVDVLNLDGAETLAFDPDPRLDPAQQSTIEFWVSAGWDEDPGYDPVILSNAGPDGASYTVAIQRERDGIAVISGEEADVLPFDFSDGQAHHVALIDLGGPIATVINGNLIGELDMTFNALASEGFFIGSAYGEEDGFVGTIGGLRIWDVAVSTDDLARYRLNDVMAEDSPHPDLEFLAAISNFTEQDIILVDRE